MPELWFLFFLCGRLVRVLKGYSFSCVGFIRFLTRQKKKKNIFYLLFLLHYNLFEYNI